MSLLNIIRNARGGDAGPQVVEGTIVSAPMQRQNEISGQTTLVFRLADYPDVEFRQELRPLVPERHRGDRVRVHFHPDGFGAAIVEWVERL